MRSLDAGAQEAGSGD